MNIKLALLLCLLLIGSFPSQSQTPTSTLTPTPTPEAGGGTTVVANPAGTATADLDKIRIDSTIYNIPSIADGKATGDLWAKSNNLPLAGSPTPPHELAVVWNNQAGSPVTIAGSRLRIPSKPAADSQLGYWLVAKSAGTVRDKIFIPWGYLNEDATGDDALLLCAAATGCLNAVITRQQAWDYAEIRFNQKNPIPANTTLEIYAAVAQGAGNGLNQTQVDARIDAAIPPARRIPSFAADDAGKIVKVNSAGAGLEIAPETVTNSNELSVLSSLPAVAGYSVGDIINVNGVLYELVASTEDAHVLRGAVTQPASGFYGIADFQWQTASPFNIRVKLPKAALGLSPPSRLYPKITFAGHGTSDLELARASGQDTSTQYAYVHNPGSAGLDFDAVGTAFSVAFYSDDMYRTAFTIHTANRWERDDRNQPNVAAVALSDNTDRWPKDKLPSDAVYTADLPHTAGAQALDETLPSFTLTATSSDYFAASPTYFSPPVDLDDHPRGEFHYSLNVSIAPASDVNMGFTQGKANQTADDRQRTLANIVFASDLAETSAFVQQSALPLNGLNIFTVPVYSRSALVGSYVILMLRNASNEVGVTYYWDGMAGATGATITAELRVTFTPTDAPAAVSSGLVSVGTYSGNILAAGSYLDLGVTIPSDGALLVVIVAGRTNVNATYFVDLARLRTLTASAAGQYATAGNAQSLSAFMGAVNIEMHFSRTSSNKLLAYPQNSMSESATAVRVFKL